MKRIFRKAVLFGSKDEVVERRERGQATEEQLLDHTINKAFDVSIARNGGRRRRMLSLESDFRISRGA